MTAALLVAIALGGIVSAWGWSRVRRQRRELAEAKRQVDAARKQMQKLQEAYKHEAERLEELARGSDADRFDASIRILRELSGGDT